MKRSKKKLCAQDGRSRCDGRASPHYVWWGWSRRDGRLLGRCDTCRREVVDGDGLHSLECAEVCGSTQMRKNHRVRHDCTSVAVVPPRIMHAILSTGIEIRNPIELEFLDPCDREAFVAAMVEYDHHMAAQFADAPEIDWSTWGCLA